MKKEIIGYKLKKNFEYCKESAQEIAFPGSGQAFNKGHPLECYLEKPYWGKYKDRLEKAGILDLWFEPIYEEVKPKFKIGDKVVVIPSDNTFDDYKRAIGHIFSLDEHCIAGIEKDNIFVEPHQKFIVNYRPKDIRLATDRDIVAYEDNLLIEEAKWRYPVGTTVNQINAYGGQRQIIKVLKDNISVNSSNGYRNVSVGNVGVYNTKYGIWAEVVKKEDLVPEITINGYQADFSIKGTVKFGCQQLTLDFIKKAKALADNNICLIDANGQDLTDEVNEIYQYLTKQK